MAGLRFTALQSRPMEFLACTSVTLDELQQLVPPFEAAFHARMAAWRRDGKPRTARRFTVYKHCPLPTPGRSAVLHSGLPQNLCPPGGPGAPVWDGAGESQSVAPRALARAAGRPTHPRRCPEPLSGRLGAAAQSLGGGRGDHGCPAGGGGDFPGRGICRRAGGPPLAHDGTERRLVRPQDPPEQTAC
jgi:hypothetical protein